MCRKEERMKFLAINTAGAAVETALVTDGDVRVKTDGAFKKASSVLLPFIDELLHTSGAALQELDFIAVVTGPGSFTGVRIGLTAARALAQFADLRLVPVTYGAVLSYNYNGQSGAESIITVSDASNGWVYIEVFDEKRNVILPPAALTTEQTAAFLAAVDEPCVICCDAACEALALSSGKPVVAFEAGGLPLVAAAKAAFARNGAVPYGQATPLYVRQSQAENDLKAVPS